MSQSPAHYDPLGPNFLEFVQEGQLLRHKPSGLIGKCIKKDRSAFMDGKTLNFSHYLKATLDFPRGGKISFTHEMLEVVEEPHG